MDVGFDWRQPVFTWSIPAAGFFLEDVEEKESPPPPALPWIIVRTRLFFDLSENKVIEYRPLEEKPTLFYDFADTEPTEEGILAFANKYGSIFQDAAELVEQRKALDDLPPVNSDDPLLARIRADRRQRLEEPIADRIPLTSWQEEIDEMSAITMLLEYWQNKDKEGLREVFIKVLRRRETGDWDFMSLWRGWPFVVDAQEARDIVRQRIMPNIMFAAQVLLMFWVNRRFEERLGSDGGHLKLSLSLNATGVFESYFEPKNLLDAMWFQLYQAVISASQGERRIKRCEICGNPEVLWEYGERKQNSNWHYHPRCYNAQKQKEYRDRKRQLKEVRVEKPAGMKSAKSPAKKAKPKAAKKPAAKKKATAKKPATKKAATKTTKTTTKGRS